MADGGPGVMVNAFREKGKVNECGGHKPRLGRPKRYLLLLTTLPHSMTRARRCMPSRNCYTEERTHWVSDQLIVTKR